MSASTGERLSDEGLFKDSPVTPAIRLNDTTDIWSARGGRYKEEPSRHHRTARIDQARRYVDIGLYSVTFSNQRDIDAMNAEAYSAFRAEAGAHGMRHFLEVFNPAFDIRLDAGRRHRRVHQRQHRAHARRRDGGRSSAVPQAPVQRPARDGGARLLRPDPPDRRHSRRRRGHHARHLRAARARPNDTAPASRCSAARSISPRRRSRS